MEEITKKEKEGFKNKKLTLFEGVRVFLFGNIFAFRFFVVRKDSVAV
jgi:hypothetical protein